ncbi:MAG: hypothetical protein IJ566_01160 [Cardiobacteriaceae bacterium]|nr:hypothetical protein [Cardiobacteriaceae bacterium]
MTAAVFGGFTVILSRRRKIYRSSFTSLRMTAVVFGGFPSAVSKKSLTVTVILRRRVGILAHQNNHHCE